MYAPLSLSRSFPHVACCRWSNRQWENIHDGGVSSPCHFSTVCNCVVRYGKELGVSPRVVHELLRMVKEDLAGEWTYTLTYSMLEIYNETIRDLLSPSSAASATSKLDVRQTPEGNIVPGLTEIPVRIVERRSLRNILCS